MLADRQSISSSIFLKSFFIFLIVSGDTWKYGLNVWVCTGQQNLKFQQQRVTRSLTCSRYELVVVFIHQRLHVTVQRADLLDHAGLLVHQLRKRALSSKLHFHIRQTMVTVTVKKSRCSVKLLYTVRKCSNIQPLPSPCKNRSYLYST